MAPDPDSQQNSSPTPSEKKVEAAASGSALAMELPFTLVGAIAVGAAIGFFADRWLHTGHILTIVLGALGFAAGVREVLRRLPG
jgi:F0F1-type ATP synthase assembly protein I